MTPSFLFSAPAEVNLAGAPVDLSGTEVSKAVLAVYGLLVLLGLAVDAGLLVYLARGRRRWAVYTRRFRLLPWTWPDAVRAVLLLVALFGFSMGVQAVVGRVAGHRLDARPGVWVLLQSVTIHWPAFAVLALVLARRGWSWRRAFGVRGRHLARHLGLGVLFYLAVIPIIAFYSWLYTLGLQAAGYDPGLQEVALAITGDASLGVRIYLFVLAVVIAPCFEEILFRGIALPLLVRRWGVHGGVALVSLVFALIHLHIPSLVALFILAMSFAYAYIYTGSIIVPVVMHGLFNAVNVGLLTYLR